MPKAPSIKYVVQCTVYSIPIHSGRWSHCLGWTAPLADIVATSRIPRTYKNRTHKYVFSGDLPPRISHHPPLLSTATHTCTHKHTPLARYIHHKRSTSSSKHRACLRHTSVWCINVVYSSFPKRSESCASSLRGGLVVRLLRVNARMRLTQASRTHHDDSFPTTQLLLLGEPSPSSWRSVHD